MLFSLPERTVSNRRAERRGLGRRTKRLKAYHAASALPMADVPVTVMHSLDRRPEYRRECGHRLWCSASDDARWTSSRVRRERNETVMDRPRLRARPPGEEPAMTEPTMTATRGTGANHLQKRTRP
jgi:hypothetical protein